MGWAKGRGIHGKDGSASAEPGTEHRRGPGVQSLRRCAEELQHSQGASVLGSVGKGPGFKATVLPQPGVSDL